SRESTLTVDADQPTFLAGDNTAPNSVEHVLHALNSCLSTTLVYHASVNSIPLDAVEVSSEGDMNARGFFGISDKVNKGYERIRVNMEVKSNADVETLTKLAMHSPVYEIVSKAVPVDFSLTKI
ncbi:MAG: OsmC family protein, partial [Gammaproteobacteria bacterium]|nr:OsmC family protein [Gammaproteobacteria bacterium]